MSKRLRIAALALMVLVVGLACGGATAPEFDVRDEVEIIKKTYHRDTIGNFIVEGEVKNNGPHVWQFVEVSAVGYDADGEVVDTGRSYVDMQRLRVGDTSAFTVYIDEEGRGITTYKVGVIDGRME